jgi:hypothetical protein
MRAVGVCAGVVVSVLVLFAGACGGADPAEIRAELESIHEFVTEGGGYDVGHRATPDGQGPAEMIMGHRSLYFRDGEIHEQVSDYWDQWTYEVAGNGRIEAYDHDGNRVKTGSYDRGSHRLWWNDVWYVAQ